MQASDSPRFGAALNSLAALFSRDLDEAAIVLYWHAVSGITIDQFEEAVKLAASKCQHFPPPYELKALVVADESPKLKAAEAWPEVMRLASRSSAEHSDPIAAEAMRMMGGGKALGQKPTDWLENWGRKQFTEFYEEIATKPQALALPPPERKALT